MNDQRTSYRNTSATVYFLKVVIGSMDCLQLFALFVVVCCRCYCCLLASSLAVVPCFVLHPAVKKTKKGS